MKGKGVKMYKEIMKIKGTDLTVGDVKRYNIENKIYEESYIDEVLNESEDDEKALIAAEGWAEEKDGYTILFEEEA